RGPARDGALGAPHPRLTFPRPLRSLNHSDSLQRHEIRAGTNPANPSGVSRRLSFLAAFLLATLTASAETLGGGPSAAKAVPGGAVVVRGAEKVRPLLPGEIRFLGPTSSPSSSVSFLAGSDADGSNSKISGPAPRVIEVPTAAPGNDPWTDTASPRLDTSRMDVIRTGAVVRIALDRP